MIKEKKKTRFSEIKYPTSEEVEDLDFITICKMYRNLPTPKNKEELCVLQDVMDRYKIEGPPTEKQRYVLGWD
jgi:hypothetical protein